MSEFSSEDVYRIAARYAEIMRMPNLQDLKGNYLPAAEELQTILEMAKTNSELDAAIESVNMGISFFYNYNNGGNS